MFDSLKKRLFGTGAKVPPTVDQIREMYGPPKTMARVPEEARAAMDSMLDGSGVWSLLQHGFEMGQMQMPQFMGYGALQALSQNGLVRACVSTVADDMTRSWVDFQRQGKAKDGTEDDRISDLASALEDLHVRSVFHDAVEMAGYEGGAFVFIDTGEENTSIPLNITANSRELRPGGTLRFVSVDPVNCYPGDYNSVSPLRPDYFKPSWWWVLGQQVHSSRLLRIVENEVPVLLKPAFNFLGIPQAQILWDYVLHFQDCRTAAARLLSKFSLTVFKTAMFDGQRFGAPQAGMVDQRLQYAVRNMSNDGIFAIDKESEDVVKVETPLSGVTDIVRQSLEFLAAVNRTPAVKLLGISPSGFNATGESDLRNYYDHIGAMQRKVLWDPIQTVLDCLQLHLFGEIDQALTFEFHPLSEEDKTQRAQLRKSQADMMAVLLDRSVISPEEARKRLAVDPESGFSDLDPEDVPETPAPDLGGLPGYGQDVGAPEPKAVFTHDPAKAVDPTQVTENSGDAGTELPDPGEGGRPHG